jgi:site-specific recombinase XerD
MHQTSLHTFASASAIAAAAVSAAAVFAAASRAPATIRATDADLRDYSSWCASVGADQQTAEAAAAYLAQLAAGGAATATVSRRASSLRATFPAVAASAIVAAVLKGIRNTNGTRPRRQADALLLPDLARLSAACPSSLAGKRDRALLLLCWWTAMRESEAVAVETADLQVDPLGRGYSLCIRRSKTDQTGEGDTVPVAARPNQPDLCPVLALQTWLAAAGITTGPVFRPVNRHQQVQPAALSADAVDGILQAACARAALPTSYSGHSLRAGFVTECALQGIDAATIARTTRHRDLRTVQRYVRIADAFTASAAPRLVLRAA